ncbi:MAG: ABC transporter substrate-binding protein [Acutalibacteraceae bacterium]
MKKFKSVLSVLLAAVMLLSLAACTGNNTQTETTTAASDATTEAVPESQQVKVAAIKGPTGMGMVKLFEDNHYKFTLTSDPTEIVSLISTGAVDIAACPLNLAANIYKKTGGKIQMLGLNTLGVLYVVTNGVEVNSLKDLSGKTVYLTGQGATPEFIVNDLLQKNDLTNDVKLEYLSEHSELVTKMASGGVQVAILPEPYVSVAGAKLENMKVALNLTDEWNKVNPDATLAMGCVIARSEFIENNPDAVEKFISDNKSSVEYVNTNPYEASAKIVSNGILDEGAFSVPEDTSESKLEKTKQEKAAEVITRCNIVFIDGEQMKTIANANFKVYFDADKTSIGGEMPQDALYYAAK